MNSVRSIAFAVSLGLCAANANATIIQIGTTAAMTQGPYTVENFEDATFVSGVTFSAPSGIRRLTSDAASSGVTSSGSYGLSSNDFPQPLTLTFAAPTSSVGMFFGNDDRCCTIGFTAYLDIFGTSGLLSTISVVANMNDFVDQFIGFTSDEWVTSVLLRYGSGSNVSLYHFIDDVQFNVATAVSEPGTLLLLGMGALGLAAARRRKA